MREEGGSGEGGERVREGGGGGRGSLQSCNTFFAIVDWTKSAFCNYEACHLSGTLPYSCIARSHFGSSLPRKYTDSRLADHCVYRIAFVFIQTK